MNVGMEQNPAIQVIDADAVYLITQSNRTFDMGKIEDFAGMTQYAIVDNLFQNTNAVAEKYKDAYGQFDYQAALTPHALNIPQNLTLYNLLLQATRMTRALTT